MKQKAGPAGATPNWLQQQQKQGALETQTHGIPEEFGLEKPFYITRSNPTQHCQGHHEPCPPVPHPQGF